MKRLTLVLVSLFFLCASPAKADYLIDTVNHVRSIANLPTLRENYALDKSATAKACDLKKTGFWSHKDTQGRMSWHLFIENGYNYSYAGENLAENCTPFGCMNLWMKSKTHRENILDPGYKEVGVGYCGVYKVMHFGTSY